MDNAGYVMLTRISGLRREMQAVAHNIANSDTTGFRREGMVFSEFVVGGRGAEASLSMARGNTRQTSPGQGALAQTGGSFDLAIEGEGYFQLETPQGPRLTRAGAFTPNAAGELVNPDGHRLLDAGGAPVFVPPDGGTVAVARDGTLSVDGAPRARIGLVRPADPTAMTRAAGTLFAVDGALEPVAGPTIVQGFLEDANVEPLQEMARMIEVQRAYERGQRLLGDEDKRIRNVISTLGR